MAEEKKVEEKPRVVVYGGPGCEGCDELKADLDKRGVPYEYKDVLKTGNPPGQEGKEAILVPVVEVCTFKREGYNPRDLDFVDAYSRLSCKGVEAFEEMRRTAGDEATHELIKRLIDKKEKEVMK